MQHQPGEKGQNACYKNGYSKQNMLYKDASLKRQDCLYSSRRYLFLSNKSGHQCQAEQESCTYLTRKLRQMATIPPCLLIHSNLQIAQNRMSVRLNSICKIFTSYPGDLVTYREARRYSRYPGRLPDIVQGSVLLT